MLKKDILKKSPILLSAVFASALTFGLTTSASAATLQLDFDVSFGDPLDAGTFPPDGTGPWMTALFDDGDTADTVTLTLTVGAIGDAEVTAIYLNVDSLLGLTATHTGGDGPAPTIITTPGTPNLQSYRADGSGLYDIVIETPASGGIGFDANETLTIDFFRTGLLASSFNELSELEGGSTTGPYIAAAKFQSTGVCVDPTDCNENSDWVGAVPIPAAVWLFGSGLLGLVGVARRKAA